MCHICIVGSDHVASEGAWSKLQIVLSCHQAAPTICSLDKLSNTKLDPFDETLVTVTSLGYTAAAQQHAAHTDSRIAAASQLAAASIGKWIGL